MTITPSTVDNSMVEDRPVKRQGMRAVQESVASYRMLAAWHVPETVLVERISHANEGTAIAMY